MVHLTGVVNSGQAIQRAPDLVQGVMIVFEVSQGFVV